MKLDHRRTILVGLAFLSICAFWQMYDSVIPKILTETFRLNETLSGAIMALDNILALFLLPLFGALSDRTSTKIGRRMPFILLGTACAAVLMNLLPVLDNRYAAAPSTGKLVGFAAVLGLLLVAMGTYRSPAVALMPDVTPNPLRSRANAIINLMGAIGGIIYLAVAAVMYPNAKIAGLAHVNYQPLFLVVSAVMLVSVAVLFLTVKEPKLAAETRALEAQHPEWDLTEDDGSGNEVLPKPVKRSLGFLLVSIALWYIGYNGVTTWWSTYVGAVMGQGLGGASTCLLIATAGAVVSYIPIGQLASRIGRKKTIYVGLGFMLIAFLGATGFGTTFFGFHMDFSGGNYFANGDFYILCFFFALCGIGWATISVNSYPMAVEMSRAGNVGKYTGYYYTASMIAQSFTPFISGLLMDFGGGIFNDKAEGMMLLFPYALVFIVLAGVTMFFVRHGDVRPELVSKLEAFDFED